MPKKDRHRINIDTDPELQGLVARLAKILKVPISQVWNYFAYMGVKEFFLDEKDDILDRLRATGKTGYKHRLDFEDIKEELRKRILGD